MDKQPIDILQAYWKHAAFRPMQEEIIDAVLAGSDTLALLPTGGGKSICFQVPANVTGRTLPGDQSADCAHEGTRCKTCERKTLPPLPFIPV